MAEYIEREAALALAESEEYLTPDGDEIYHEYIPVSAVKSIPAADVRPVVVCADCKGRTSVKFNYCPNCGADMREES